MNPAITVIAITTVMGVVSATATTTMKCLIGYNALMVGRMTGLVGFRGVILLIFGMFSLMFGLGSLGSTPSSQALANAQVIITLAPLVYWYAFWTVVGITCFTGAFAKRVDPIAYGAWSFACFVFSLGYLSCQMLDWIGWAHAVNGVEVHRAGISALLFGVLGFLGLVEGRRP